MRKIPIFLALALSLWYLACPRAIQAQEALEVSKVAVDYDFARQIHFEFELPHSAELENARLLFQVEGEPFTQVVPCQSLGGGRFAVTYTLLDAIPAFSSLTFWMEGEHAGVTLASPRYRFRYLDDRFPWQSRQEGNIRLFWYEGDARFVQMVLDTALRGLQTIESKSGLRLKAPLELYVYASGADLQSALGNGASGWESGHASPRLGVALAAITPGPNQSLVAERLIPHELMHILLYRELGRGYDALPVWLREGLAKWVELSPDADAERVVKQAIADNTFIPFQELCPSFPLEAGRAYLSYAQAFTFVRYLSETYGQEALNRLLHAYADGLGCEQGVLKVYGKSLATLEYEWRVSLSGGVFWHGVLRNLSPYLLFLALFLGYPLILLFRRRIG
jgi:hypothetical protein